MLQTGEQQNVVVTDDVFAFVRAASGGGCSTDHVQERVLVVVNKAQETRTVDLPLENTALFGCTEFKVLEPVTGSAVRLDAGKLHVDQGAESMTLYGVR